MKSWDGRTDKQVLDEFVESFGDKDLGGGNEQPVKNQLVRNK